MEWTNLLRNGIRNLLCRIVHELFAWCPWRAIGGIREWPERYTDHDFFCSCLAHRNAENFVAHKRWAIRAFLMVSGYGSLE